ncbi:amidohydrolase family protein [Nitratireductor sp. CH_MIT9313-5]|uniref:amidohydrolase family protein n=1 Tax=Nitratireductor sp. CH_MIT9313-5 TaxID=3107764 RepID=UPI00300A2C51
MDAPSKPDLLLQIGPVVDAHHHFWDLEKNHYPWLQEAPVKAHFGDYGAIRRSYLPADLRKDAGAIDLLATVHVEAHWRGGREPEGETAWLGGLARDCGFPGAIVGFCDLLSANCDEVLARHQQHSRLRGIRMLTQRPGNPSGSALMRDTRFREGLKKVAAAGLSFDLQTTAQTMPAAVELVQDLPELSFALTHAGLPLDRSEAGLAAWRRGIAALSACSNVTAKLSGLPMCDWRWSVGSLRPFVLHLLESFGPERVMFGSNFPVDGLFSSYTDLLTAYAQIVLEGCGEKALSPVFRDTALRFYRIKPTETLSGVTHV